MAKVAIKSEKLTPFGGIFPIMELFDSKLSSVIDSTPWYEMQTVWLSIQRNHPFAYERLFLWRHMYRGYDLLYPRQQFDSTHIHISHLYL